MYYCTFMMTVIIVMAVSVQFVCRPVPMQGLQPGDLPD
jgi:hypothetical protein